MTNYSFKVFSSVSGTAKTPGNQGVAGNARALPWRPKNYTGVMCVNWAQTVDSPLLYFHSDFSVLCFTGNEDCSTALRRKILQALVRKKVTYA